MVTPTARRDVFQAIADPNRRAIINLLASKKLTLNGLADQFAVSRPAISKHVKILSECGLVSIEQQGRERYCVLKAEKLGEVSNWVEQYRKFLTERLDALEIYLAELQAAEKYLKRPGRPKGKAIEPHAPAKQKLKSERRRKTSGGMSNETAHGRYKK